MRMEQLGAATLILADCREVMQELKADVIVTDPVWPNCPPNSVAGSDNPHGLFETACMRLPVHQRAVIVMRCDSDPRFLAAYRWHPFFRSILLPYVMPAYLGRVLGGDELAYWFGAPTKSGPGRHLVPGRAPAAQPQQRPANGHPMSRAQVHFDWLVDRATDAGEVVLDPFMGSGTTGVGCVRAGRRFIGIEVEPRFFDLACKRIEQAQRQADMFIAAPEAAHGH